jgi:hypothetical protein
MPTTTWRSARRDIARPFGLLQFDTTTNLTTNDQIISTDIANQFSADDTFNNWYVIIVTDADGSGSPANGVGTVIRRVEDYTGSSGALTVVGANLTAEDESVTCDLYRYFHPNDIKIAFNKAVADSYPHVSQARDYRDILTEVKSRVYPLRSTMRKVDRVEMGTSILSSDEENLLTDGGFEDWSNDTTLASWSLSGSNSTVNKESETTGPTNHMVLTGSYSARLYIEDTNTTLLQTVTPSVATQMVEVSMAAYVYCRVGSSVALQLDGNTGSYHTGTGWELLHYAATTGHSDASFAAGFYGNGSVRATSYIDRVAVWAGPREPREELWTPVTQWEWMPPLAGASDGGKIHLRGYPRRGGEILRVVGRDAVSTVSADTDTVEIDGHLLKPLYALTRAYMCEDKAMGRSPRSGIDWAQRAEEYHIEYQRAIADPMYQATSRPKVRQPQVVF